MADFADPAALVRELLRLLFLPKPDGSYRTIAEILAEADDPEAEPRAE